MHRETFKKPDFLKKPLSIMKKWNGKLTHDLVQSPSLFGLGRLPKKLTPDKVTNSVCGFCSTGCGLNIHIKNNWAVNLTPTTSYPVNIGQACPKGWEALSPLSSANRAETPYLRKGNTLEPLGWDEALTTFKDRFSSIKNKYGEDSLAFIGTGQIPTEEMALLGTLAKFAMGIKHGDSNTRQCMATSTVAYKQSFGFDAPPYSYQDFEESDVIVLIGSNLCIAHPIMWERICKNKNYPEIIVIDPRRTETATQAIDHLDLNPKSDLILFYGIANILIKNNWIDNKFIDKHTNDFESFKNFVSDYDEKMVSEATGLSIDRLNNFAQKINKGKAVSFWWTMGVNQGHEAVRTAQSIINLALMTGNIGRPGTGANSITGQTNAMGSRLFSNTSNMVGHLDFTNEKHRKKVADILEINEENIPKEDSLPYHKILENIKKGKIKGLWVIGTNPGHSWINRSEFKEIISKLDFFVVQDMYKNTDSAQLADLILPAAGWGEKEGTVINSERRIGLQKRVSKAPGKALADFYIFKLIAEKWGCGPMFKNWTSPEAAFQILKKLTKGSPCDFSGIKDYKMLESNGGVQWPLPQNSKHIDSTNLVVKERRLFEDNKFYHPDSRAKFIFEKPRNIYESTDTAFPLVLLTGRGSSAQWHTLTRTNESAVLRKLAPKEDYVEIHPDDAEIYFIKPGQKIKISSRRGEMQALANITPTVGKGQVFIAMHSKGTNLLTYPAFDPYSHQPSYKFSAVKIRPMEIKIK